MLTWLRLYRYFRRGGMSRTRAALRAFKRFDDWQRTAPAVSSSFGVTRRD